MTEPIRYFQIPEDTVYLLLGILRLEKDGVGNPQSNIEKAMNELVAIARARGPVAEHPLAQQQAYVCKEGYTPDLKFRCGQQRDIKNPDCSKCGSGILQQAPTNHLAIPCPKCGKWIFRANVDEGYTLFCSDDECGWKQKIVAQQAQQAPAAIITTTKDMESYNTILLSPQGKHESPPRILSPICSNCDNCNEWDAAVDEMLRLLKFRFDDTKRGRSLIPVFEEVADSVRQDTEWVSQHDAALIAQEREKWERERDTEELTPFVKRKMAQAREDVLTPLRRAYGKFKCHNILLSEVGSKCGDAKTATMMEVAGELWISIKESLRSEVKK